MERGGYGQFCPVALASEILCTRWTIVLLRELLAGSTRFNELRRGVPRMSPGLLSKRLKELETAGIVYRVSDRAGGNVEYCLTQAGAALGPIVMALGDWGHRFLDTGRSLRNLDPSLLMWDMRRNVNLRPLPRRQIVVQFIYDDVPASARNWWLIMCPGKEVDLCSVDPGFAVDLYVETSLRTMTAIWMGYSSLEREVASGALSLTGDVSVSKRMGEWLGLSPFARRARQSASSEARDPIPAGR